MAESESQKAAAEDATAARDAKSEPPAEPKDAPPAEVTQPAPEAAEAVSAHAPEPPAPAGVPPEKAASEPPPAKPASVPPAKAAAAGAFPTATSAPAGDALAAYEALARSARLADIVAIAQKILADAATSRRAQWSVAAKVTEAADEAKLSHADADTAFGNALKVLGTGPEGEAERALACALSAHAVAESPRKEEDRLAGDVLWLATHTAFDATALLDRALGDEAADLWSAMGSRVRRIDEGRGGALGRGEAFVGAAAIASSSSPAAKKVAADLARHAKDPMLARLVGDVEAAASEVRLEGELVPAPRGFVATALLAMTGILFAVHGARLIARLALAYRRPAEVSLSREGVRVRTRTEMLGRVLREREHVIAKGGLVRVVREVRYPRAAFYAGLLALALGSYVGVRALADGVRAASPSLLLTGLVIVALGIAADFVLGSVLPGARGRVRVQFVPRRGPTLCVADVDATRADAALTRALRV